MRMRSAWAAAATVGSMLAIASPAAAIDQPPGSLENVELVGNLPEGKYATAINFLTYGSGSNARDVMLITGRFGLKTYDLADPTQPVLLDEVGNEDLRLPGDPPAKLDPPQQSTYWQNEDMDIDARRKLAFLSRDPRSFRGSTGSDASIAGVYIIDAKDPEDLQLISFKQLPTGHTTSCVNDCDFLWTGGPASTASQQQAPLNWTGGRPIIVTDVRDPAHPVSYQDQPVDLFRQDGVTAYSHDVDVDDAGIAWVSGLGGMRGYWTEGRHYDPLLGAVREATAVEPIPYAGGGLADDATSWPESAEEDADTRGGWMHNGMRPVGNGLEDGPRFGPGGIKPGSLVMGTEEWFNDSTCDGEGQFIIASLDGSYDGEGWKSTRDDPFRLKTVGTWSPKDKEGTVPLPSCSAHYFDLKDRLIAYAWYGQGTRFLDVTDAGNPIQVAYYRPDGGNVWASYFHDGYVYTADHARGIDVLRLTGGVEDQRKKGKDLVAPAMSEAQATFLREQAGTELRPDPQLGWLCPLPA
jgi:hypothetical protein